MKSGFILDNLRSHLHKFLKCITGESQYIYEIFQISLGKAAIDILLSV